MRARISRAPAAGIRCRVVKKTRRARRVVIMYPRLFFRSSKPRDPAKGGIDSRPSAGDKGSGDGDDACTELETARGRDQVQSGEKNEKSSKSCHNVSAFIFQKLEATRSR